MEFSSLGLSPKVLEAVTAAGYTTPTAIQAEAIPHALARRDVLGLAQTGSGKTAAFVLPMLTLLEKGRARARMPRTLILEPTRELAVQVQEAFESLGKLHKLTVALLIGGVAFEPQAAKIDRGADVVIATPGRLLDHFERGKLLLNGVELLVIDEADRMLDMGFIPDIERICKLLPFTRQTLFFSATMPTEIQRITAQFLHNPVEVKTSAVSSTVTTIKQYLVKAPSDPAAKRDILRALIRSQPNINNAIVFANRKTTVALLEKSLRRHGFNAGALHGDMDQSARLKMLAAFRSQEVTILIASDVAARGLDIPEVSHVFNFDVPIHSEDYVHRIGRTGRAGREGHAFMLVGKMDTKHLSAIQALINKDVEWFEVSGATAESENAEAVEASPPKRSRRPAVKRTAKETTQPKIAAVGAVETAVVAPVVALESSVVVQDSSPPRPARQPHAPHLDANRENNRSNRRPRFADDDAPDHNGFNQGNMPAFLSKPVRNPAA